MGTIVGPTIPTGTSIARGGVAGAKQVEGGITPADSLIVVYEFSEDLATGNDKTAEYSITDANEISNGGGTSDAGNFLVVVWQEPA